MNSATLTAPSRASTKTIDEHIAVLCNSVMRGTANALGNRIVWTDKLYAEATKVMRAEVKAFIFEPEYASEREVVLRCSMHDDYVVAELVATCVLKILAVAKAA